MRKGKGAGYLVVVCYCDVVRHCISIQNKEKHQETLSLNKHQEKCGPCDFCNSHLVPNIPFPWHSKMLLNQIWVPEQTEVEAWCIKAMQTTACHVQQCLTGQRIWILGSSRNVYTLPLVLEFYLFLFFIYSFSSVCSISTLTLNRCC